MFTGIVEEVGTVKAVQHGRLTVSASKVLPDTKLGDSLSVNGACLTVTSRDKDSFSVDIMPETARRTNLERIRTGASVNLERALSLGGRLGGHLVQGHVDDTGRVLALTPVEGAILIKYSASPDILRYIVPKGFVAVDGASLTVVDCDDTSLTVSLVTFTQQNTNLAQRQPGDLVNLEVDIIAKYVEKLKTNYSGITREVLAEHGFLHS